MSDDQSNPPELEPRLDPADEPIDEHHQLILRLISPDLLKFKLPWANRYNLPVAVDCEIDALGLLRFIRIALIEITRQKFGLEGWNYEVWGKYDDPVSAKLRDELITDEDFLKAESDAFYFCIRHYPTIATYGFGLIVTAAQLHVTSSALFEDNPDEREAFLRGALRTMFKDLQNEIKEILGTRRRGGSEAKLTGEIRTSLHEYYDDIHLMTRPIKKDYNNTFKRFEESRRHTGYKFEEWRQFWINHAKAFYPDLDEDFLASFAETDHPSASELAYRWLSHRGCGKRSYVETLVKKSRKAAGKTRPRKGTMKKAV
ncbi:MAG TPA: hypothetical protein VF656_16950 [Pyrinomonadaceae bacterium]